MTVRAEVGLLARDVDRPEWALTPRTKPGKIGLGRFEPFGEVDLFEPDVAEISEQPGKVVAGHRTRGPSRGPARARSENFRERRCGGDRTYEDVTSQRNDSETDASAVLLSHSSNEAPALEW